MKAAMKRLIRDENGQTLILALILVAVGGLIIAPSLDYMGTGVITGKVYERKTAELYAADAGAEDAVWKIQHQVDEVKALTQCNQHWTYNISDVNGKSVEVTITYKPYAPGMAYLIESTATGDGSGTNITAYVTSTILYHDFSGITDHIVTCQGETDIAKKVTLVYPPGNGPVENYELDWPAPQELEKFYWEDVKDQTPYGSGTIDLNGNNMNLGPAYRNGALEILNSSNTPATLTLTGTIYITGDTLIGQTGKDFTLDLNGYTIFVSSNTTGSQKALIVGGKCTIQGPGAIIAIGDVYFAPKAQAGGEGEPIFVLSVSGTTLMQPSGDFYGALAGSVEVEIKQGTTPTITFPEEGFGTLVNFPSILEAGRIYSVASWEVTQP